MDLVPVRYRRTLELRRWMRVLLSIEAALVLMLVFAKSGFAYGEMSRRRHIEAVRVAEERAVERRAELAELDLERRKAERRLAIMDGLRGGISSDAVFGAVDRSLDEGIWFLDWRFSRAGQLVDDDPQAVKTGYFLVVPLDGVSEATSGRAWRLETHMEIHGQAIDHSTLAGFVDRLLDEPRIEQVRIVSTRMQRVTDAEVVAFELAVVVRTDA